MGTRLNTTKEIEDLKRQLQSAINIEAYEEAARIRDRIKNWKRNRSRGDRP
jgi:protein-arginine kinase activator protein McsA